VAEAQAASRAANRAISPTLKSPKATKGVKKAGTASGSATPTRKGSDSAALEQRNIDVSALGLGVEEKSPVQEEPPRMAIAREKILEEAAKALEAESRGQAGVSLVVIGERVRFMTSPVTDAYTLQATSMLESPRSWEDCSMTPVALTKNQKWRTKERVVRLAKGASAGRGSLTVPPRNASGKHNLTVVGIGEYG
jgi:hypothetical protein